MNKIVYILCKIVYVKYLELCAFFKTISTLNVKNCVDSLKKFVY